MFIVAKKHLKLQKVKRKSIENPKVFLLNFTNALYVIGDFGVPKKELIIHFRDFRVPKK